MIRLLIQSKKSFKHLSKLINKDLWVLFSVTFMVKFVPKCVMISNRLPIGIKVLIFTTMYLRVKLVIYYKYEQKWSLFHLPHC